MNKLFASTIYILCLSGLVFSAGGCGDKSSTERKSQVISKKISAPKPEKKVQKEPATKPAFKAPKIAPAKKADKNDKALKQKADKKKIAKKAEKAIPKKPAEKTLPALLKSPKEKNAPLISSGYDPKGKIDPFEPLFKEKTFAPQAASYKVKMKKRIPRTPLERMDISQMKLVAVIQAMSGNRALVQDAAGKGFIVTKGTYIGTNSGQVINVLKDRLVIEEEIQNLLGAVSLQKRELRILKPPGAF